MPKAGSHTLSEHGDRSFSRSAINSAYAITDCTTGTNCYRTQPSFSRFVSNRCQFQHFQNYLTGLIVLDNKTMANITRCVLDSADKTNLSRFFSEANWDVESVNKERVAYLLRKTQKHRLAARKSVLPIDDTLFEHVGSLFEYIDKHYNHGNNTYPLAHNLVTSHYVSGAVRFPVGWRLYRRYEEFTHWEAFVAKHFPDATIPKQKKNATSSKKKWNQLCWLTRNFRLCMRRFAPRFRWRLNW